MSPEEKILERITVRNILALLLVGTYSFMWAFVLENAIKNATTVNQAVSNLTDFVGIISTMTVLVTLVVQFYFRRANPK